jgi:3-phosphoshikimate 1-carboxyvinyltransferase
MPPGPLSDRLEILTGGPVRGTVQPPGSKSLTNRALVCAALADGSSLLRGALFSEDTEVMIQSLGALGVQVHADSTAGQLRVIGCCGMLPADEAQLYTANSGTTIRFLTAVTTLGRGPYRLDGVPRMRQRPIGDLIEALRALGADVASEAGNGCPPVIVRGRGLAGGRAAIRGDVSSQFLSALLLVAPYAREDVQLEVDGPLVSRPYIAMTERVMESFGVTVDRGAGQAYRVAAGQRYHGQEYAIEPDASAASYFWAAAAITGGRVTVSGLDHSSLQGDVQFCECLARMGCDVRSAGGQTTVTGARLRGIEADMHAISDTVQTLAAVALFAEGSTTMRGVGHIRHKETDRIGDLARELRRLGAHVEELADGLRITPGPLHGSAVETYHDHRMAMSLALVGLRVPGIVILDPGCTVKTYPGYFRDLQALRGR